MSCRFVYTSWTRRITGRSSFPARAVEVLVAAALGGTAVAVGVGTQNVAVESLDAKAGRDHQ